MDNSGELIPGKTGIYCTVELISDWLHFWGVERKLVDKNQEKDSSIAVVGSELSKYIYYKACHPD